MSEKLSVSPGNHFVVEKRFNDPKIFPLGYKIDKNGYFLLGRKIKKYRCNEVGVLLIVLAKMIDIGKQKN